MPLALRNLLVTALLALPCAAFGQVSSQDAEALLKKNGMWDQLGGVAAQSSAGFEQALESGSGKMTADERKRVAGLFADAYNVTRLQATALHVVAAKVSTQQLGVLSAWYDSAIGKAIAAREIAAGTAQDGAEQQLRRGMDALSHASEARKAQLNHIVAVTHAAEAGATILTDSAIAIRQGIVEVDPGTPGPSVRELADVLARQRPQIEQRYSTIMLASMASMYEAVGDADLQRYADFLSSPAGEGFNQICIQALRDAMVEAANEFGRLLKQSGLKKSA